MNTWQKRARLLIAIAAVAFAVIVALAFKRRPAPERSSASSLTDPKALVETAGGRTFRFNRAHEDVRIEYEKLLGYQDGSTKLFGVRVVTERDRGRTFTIGGREASVSKGETDFDLNGDVSVTTDDGLTLRTEHATYSESDGVVHAPGAVDFSHGRMTGTAVGLIYDKDRNLVSLLDQVVLHMTPDSQGTGPTDVAAPTAEFERNERIIHFVKGLNATRGGQTIRADSGDVHLSDDEQRMESVDLRGNSRVTGNDPDVGALKSMAGRDITLKYAADGEAIEHASVAGNASIQLAGARGQAGRQITANTVELSMAPNGSTPTALVARENAQLVFPPEPGSAGRTINAQSLDSKGDAEHGLTTARFEGAVRYHEQGAGVDRRAASDTLDVILAPGMSSIDDARFRKSVRFEDGAMTATAAEARYEIAAGVLGLTGTQGGSVPRVDNDRIAVDASKIDITLAGPLVKANGMVKSTLKAQQKVEGKESGTRVPSLLKQDQDVTVMAGSLDYDGELSKAHYSGDARLYQGETTIKGDTIVIDDQDGGLTASGAENPVVSSMVREQINKDKKAERVSSTATADDLQYDDDSHRLTYSGDAHLSGTDGDMTAATIELYLNDSGDEIERVEAYDSVTLKEPSRRKTTGKRLTYTSAGEQYVVTGTPVVVLDPCGRETKGRTLTMFKATDRIVVDGNEQSRTQTKGVSNCP